MQELPRYALVLCTAMLLTACSMFEQPKDVVLIREPGHRQYAAPVHAAESASYLWEYAVLSSNVYNGEWQQATGKNTQPAVEKSEIPPDDTDPYVRACVTKPTGFLPLDGWTRWSDFPSPELRKNAQELGLYVEVWEQSAAPHTVAVVFEGTNFTSWADWKSNLRWFFRFVPGHRDQYTLVAEDVGKEFVEAFAKRKPAISNADSATVRVVATGHSLGGGLAQQFAYALPLKSPDNIEVPRVSRVYAFDPSLVTGWYSVVDAELRTRNASGLEIDRVFEHGEILAYLRLMQSYLFPPSDENPAIREIRYNFVRSANILASHSMLQLACNLAQAGRQPARVTGK